MGLLSQQYGCSQWPHAYNGTMLWTLVISINLEKQIQTSAADPHSQESVVKNDLTELEDLLDDLSA
jgi:hypothetical protein